MIRPPELYRAADHAAKQHSEEQKTDFALALWERRMMKHAASAEEAREHHSNAMYWTRRFLSGKVDAP